MFNMGDKTYDNRPPYMSENVAVGIVNFLKKGCVDLGVSTLFISFHGGEPMMQKKSSFEFFCKLFYEELSPVVDVDLYLHTNAMLIDDEWLELFHKYNVGVGVSVDGVKEHHDVYRRDKQGRGTYDRVVEGIRKLSSNHFIKEMGHYGLLCVVNPEHDAKQIYRHFVDELDAKCIDFLLPHCNHDVKPGLDPIKYGEFLLAIFNEWIEDDDPSIYVRFISSMLDILFNRKSHYMYGVGSNNSGDIPIICINSDGSLGPTDEFRTTSTEIYYTNSNVNNTTLEKYLSIPLFQEIAFALENVHEDCKKCEWVKICRGGSITNRFSIKNGFNNASVYCEGLKVFYRGVLDYLKENTSFDERQIISKFGNVFLGETDIP